MVLTDSLQRVTGSPAVSAPRIGYAVVLDPGHKLGSGEEQIILLANALRDSGGHCTAIFSTPSPRPRLDDYTQRGVEAVAIDLTRFSWSSLRRLIDVVDRGRLDALHWNLFHPLHNPFMWALTVLRPRLRHLYTDHVSRTKAPAVGSPSLAHRAHRLLWRRYAGIHCVSDYVREELMARTGLRKATTVRHFMNITRFRPDPAVRAAKRAALGLADDIVILFVGYLIPEKGVDVAIRALAGLPQRTKLLVAGNGPQEAVLKALARDLGIADRVHFLGLVRETDRYFQCADVAVCPSMWAEAAGFVNLEAQACGLPVVASRIGGIPEYVLDGRTGLLFEPGNAAEMAALLGSLIHDRELRDRLARQARAHAVADFSPERGTRDMLAWYAEVAGDWPSTAGRRLPHDRSVARG